MRTNLVVLCWLALVTMLVAGCATTGQVRQALPEKPRIVREVVLPKQEAWCPFWIRKAHTGERFWKKDLVTVGAVLEHMEALEKTGKIPLRVQEGFIMRQDGKWVIIRGAVREYYIVDLNKMM